MYGFLRSGVFLSDAQVRRFRHLYPFEVPRHIISLTKQINRDDLIVPLDTATAALAEKALGLPPSQAVRILAMWKLMELSPLYRHILPIILCLEGKDAST